MRLICKDTNKGSITFFTKGSEYLSDTMGLDKNVIVEYFNKIGNG